MKTRGQKATVISTHIRGAAALRELGQSIAEERLRRNVTQEDLAQEAGISRSTLKRMEAGDSTQTSALVRVLGSLGWLDRLESVLSGPEATPMQHLEGTAQKRQRASSRGRDGASPSGASDEWTWGEDR